MANKTLVESTNLQSSTPKHLIAANREILRENIKNRSGNYSETISWENNLKCEVPNEFLEKKIIQQVEYLFSDANISKDKFLLKHMQRNKEGYVSLKLICSLRKVKALSKDWRVVAYSLQKSQRLAMNTEMTKIRRLDPLPSTKVLDTSRTVLVFNYQNASVFAYEELKKPLETLGRVVSMVIVQSQADVKNVSVKKTLALYDKIATYPFAIVKFEKPEQSLNAVLYTSYPTSAWKAVSLIEGGNAAKSIVSAQKCAGKKWFARNGESSASFDDKKENMQAVDAPKGENETSSDRDTCSYKVKGTWRGKWVQRKNITDKVASASNGPSIVILRFPRGPDGTNGFYRSADVASVNIEYSVQNAFKNVSLTKI